mgnify:CR=1 FL=1
MYVMNRRSFIQGVGLTAAVFTAGCSSDDESPTDTGPDIEVTDNPYDGLSLGGFTLENSTVQGTDVVTLSVTFENTTGEELHPTVEITVYDPEETIIADRDVDGWDREDIPAEESIQIDYDFRGDVEDVGHITISVTDQYD